MSASDNPTAGLSPVAGLDCQSKDVTEILQRALAEDLGAGTPPEAWAQGGDLTTDATLPEPVPAVGHFLAQEVMVAAGLPVVERLYQLLDPKIQFTPRVQEGHLVSRGILAEARGDARSLLKGERTALNFLQRLSGIATLTRRFVTRLQGTKAQLRDTRKTTPGLRVLERYAVRVGGGTNHRFGLFDAVLIKENHARLAGGVGEAVRRARQKYGHAQVVQAEVRDEAEVRQALEAGADALLLDNMSIEQVDLAVDVVQGRAWTEASGGMSLENIRAYAECGVDFISVGALTHSAVAANISFDVQPAGPSA